MGQSGNAEFERLKVQEYDKFNIKDIKDYAKQGIHKICFISLKQEDVDNALKELKDDVNVVIHEMFDETTINGELISKTDNKATADAIDYLNIDIKDTIAFGDSMNDYEMIDFVDHGVVMANGSTKLKEIASSIY